jgi:Flp pilus assembly protein CpaB
MRRGRIFIILGVILGLGTAVAAIILLQPPSAPPPGEATPEIVTTQEVVMAMQNVARGDVIVPEAVELRELEIDQVPRGAMTILDEVIGRIAIADIFQGQVIQESMIIDIEERWSEGQASILIPKGKVAIAFPINELSSVSYAIQAGDLVDVLISMRFIEVDETYQMKKPFGGYVERAEEVPCELCMPSPSRERDQIPRPVTQLIVQDVEIMRVGTWAGAGEAPPPSEEEGEAPPAEEEEAAPPPATPDYVTLLVNHQDALVLKWARESGATIDLALRAAEDHDIVTTEPVTLDYMLARFGITVPPKRSYSLESIPTGPAGVGAASPE